MNRSKTPAVVGAVLALVAIVALVVVLAARGGDDGDAAADTTVDVTTEATTVTTDAATGTTDAATGTSDATGTTQGPAVTEAPDPELPPELVGEIRPVTVTGEALAPLEGDPDPAVGALAPTLTGENFDDEQVVVGGESDTPTMVMFLAH